MSDDTEIIISDWYGDAFKLLIGCDLDHLYFSYDSYSGEVKTIDFILEENPNLSKEDLVEYEGMKKVILLVTP